MSAHLVAWGAISALGEGSAALGVADVDAPATTAIARDDELAQAGLARPFAGRASVVALPGEDRAVVLLGRALRACALDLDAARPAWRSERVGLALGTSSGGMRGAELLFRALERGEPVPVDVARSATYFAPLASVFAATGVASFAPATLVLTACAASTLAMGLALRWLQDDACDLVLAGGFDAVSVFVASGFEALRATTASPPARAFGRDRDGMSVGEGAAIVALARAAPRARAFLSGFGAASDATHITAPHREGVGLARAAERALADACVAPRAIDLVSPHATATAFNDAAEAKAIARVLGPREPGILVHPLKGQIGHTMGAAGALESLASVDAMTRGILPASAAAEHRDEELGVTLRATSAAGAPRAALKLSAAFGGADAALVWTRDAPVERARRVREVFVGRAVEIHEAPDLPGLAARVGSTVERLARTDALARLALTAVAGLAEVSGSLAGAGVVVGHGLATLETNATYFERVLARGATAAEARRFPATTPHAVAGECSLAFGLDGPGLAVGAGLSGAVEALAAAIDLVRAGDADRVVVVAADVTGPATLALARALGEPMPEAGAIALLVTSSSSGYARVAHVERQLVSLDAVPRAERSAIGHLALAPLTGAAPPPEVAASSRWGCVARARITFDPAPPA